MDLASDRIFGRSVIHDLEVGMNDHTPTIAVVGSLNMDLVTRTERRPQPGETLLGESFAMFVGGKGLNQAIAAARSGAHVRMIGRIGRDDFGAQLLRTLEAEQIDTSYVTHDDETGSGVATIVVDGSGDNTIIVVSGANWRLSPADVERAADAIATADALVMQLESPLDAVVRAAEIAHAAGVRVLLNPAPARALPDELLRLVSVITPNETEARLLTGFESADDASAEQAARALLARGVGAAVLTLGGRGALLVDGERVVRVPGYSATVVDTTAAGDAFCGALAVQLARGRPLEQAVQFANAAGALATTIAGAEPAMPRAEAVERLVSKGRLAGT
jgi:ribokinase